MSDEEDDYLSDKFLAAAVSTSSPPKTYSSLRKQSQLRSQLKNEQGRTKSRRQRELESREQGLSQSLFERAKDEQEAGVSSGNKALSIMMKMGFKPGQALGQTDDHDTQSSQTPGEDGETTKDDVAPSVPKHKVEPLPINEWQGKKGIGLVTLKRSRSPTSSQDRVTKMAKMAEESSRHKDFRERAKQQYNEKRAEGRLGPAQSTCITLDEKKGVSFNVLWLNPNDPSSFPEGLLEALALHTSYDPRVISRGNDTSIESILRQQMRADSLSAVTEDNADARRKDVAPEKKYSRDILEEAAQYLRLQAHDRLQLVLSYLREQYFYCFWCGTQYPDEEEMEELCPGIDEELHD
ncbi:hypothetical protein EYR40_005448 [Pleurotus pulmonarius]|nr:hypothetical protein EYR40_005448 [Pleurotus pulmonarius]